MCECMTFPDTVEEFMEAYKVVDTEQVYTNGTEFVPIFRMKQWFGHISAQPEIIRCKDCKWRCEPRDDSAFYPYCEKLFNMGMYVYDYMMKDDDFCSLAERRTDERSD